MFVIVLCGTFLNAALICYLAKYMLLYQSKKNKSTPKISILIAAKDEEENLKQYIPQLITQEYPQFEIMVVLDRTRDDSLALLKSMKHASLKWVEIHSTPSGWDHKKYALTQGAKNIVGEWIVLTDADCRVDSKKWLSSLAKEMTHEMDIVIGISPYVASKSLLSRFIRYENLMTAFLYIGMALSKNPYMAVGRNMAIRKKFFESSGGYHSFQHIRGGDDDLFIQKNANKNNLGVAMDGNAIIHTFSSKGVKQYFSQKIRHLSVGRYYKKQNLFFISLFHLSNIMVWSSLILGVLESTHYFIILAISLLIKWITFSFVYHKMKIKFPKISFMILDGIFTVNWCMMLLLSVFTKKAQWKN